MESNREERNIFKETIKSLESVRDRRLHLNIESGLFLFLIGIIIFIRVTNLTDNTLFVDEAIYATLGEEVLTGNFFQNATTWMYGSYLYPIMAAIAGHFGGVVGLRLLSVLSNTTAAVFVFLTTLRLFGQKSALWAMLVFGLTGGSISLAQLALYDAPSVLLLAMAVYFTVTAAMKTEARHNYYLLAAAMSFSFAVLFKYIAILYLPALTLVAFALYFANNRSLRPLFTNFLGVIALILGAYVLRYLSDLTTLFSYGGGVYSFQPSTRWIIAKVIWDELGVAMLMALLGTIVITRMSFDRLSHRTRWVILSAATIVPLLFLAAPIYHLLNENIGSMWKHLVYSLVFLSPLAGRGFAALVWQYRLGSKWRVNYYPIIGSALLIAGMAWFVDHSLDQNWWIQHSWPNATGVVAYMQSQGLTPKNRVLADGAQIYEYYFDFGVDDRDTWHNTWYLEYNGLQGTEAMIAAIREHQFNFVVLDGYYNPAATPDLEVALKSAGYTLGYEELQKLSSFHNDIHLRVYVLPEYAQRGN